MWGRLMQIIQPFKERPAPVDPFDADAQRRAAREAAAEARRLHRQTRQADAALERRTHAILWGMH